MQYKNTHLKLGLVQRKILLLLATGIGLALSANPSAYFRILRSSQTEWRKINQRSLHEAIKKLYQSKLISHTENDDGTVTMTLTDRGKKKTLCFNLETISLKKQKVWDGLWRIVTFDVPEHLKKGRDALSLKLKQLGFYRIQKSVFIYPHECRDEIDFIIEAFELRPYVRFIIAKETDIDLDIKHKFKLRS